MINMGYRSCWKTYEKGVKLAVRELFMTHPNHLCDLQEHCEPEELIENLFKNAAMKIT